jgi:hypothetical protein
MAARLSTGLVKSLMDTSSFRTLFALGFIDIYSGTQPASADTAASGTKLVTLYSDGASAGLSWAATAPGGVQAKLASETWSGTVAATGTAGYFRLRAVNNPGAFIAGGTVTAAARAAANSVLVFTENGHANLVGDRVVTTGFTPAAYNVVGTIVAADTNTFSVIADSNTYSAGGDSTSVQGTYTRSRPAADPGTATSTTAVRYDGAIATSGGEMTLGNLSLISGAPFVLSAAAFTLPQQ